MYLQSVSILETAGRPQQAGVWLKIAELYLRQGRYAESERSYLRAVAALEEIHGPAHPNIARVLKTFVALVFQRLCAR